MVVWRERTAANTCGSGSVDSSVAMAVLELVIKRVTTCMNAQRMLLRCSYSPVLELQNPEFRALGKRTYVACLEDLGTP
jgi:hypothetical protein